MERSTRGSTRGPYGPKQTFLVTSDKSIGTVGHIQEGASFCFSKVRIGFMKRMFSRVIGVNVDISSADVKVVLSFCMMAIWRREYGDMTCIVDFTSYAPIEKGSTTCL